jgi:hypothetical protein
LKVVQQIAVNSLIRIKGLGMAPEEFTGLDRRKEFAQG